MKFRGTKLSKRTIALLAAAVLMLGTGGTMATLAEPGITSRDYQAEVVLNEIQVDLTEAGKSVGGTSEAPGTLFSSLGTVAPGKLMADEISVKNTGSADEYVRVIVRKYWTEGDSKSELTQTLDPSLIELKTASGWKEVPSDINDEYSIYYLQQKLDSGASAVLFTGIRINEKVLTEGKKIMIGTTEYASDEEAAKAAKPGDVITYTYTYNGISFNVEAEAQGVQTHNSSDAIKSIWGVDAGSLGISLVD